MRLNKTNLRSKKHLQGVKEKEGEEGGEEEVEAEVEVEEEHPFPLRFHYSCSLQKIS